MTLRIDGHLHVFRSREEGHRAKADYPIHEYGAKEDVVFSERGGDVVEALAALAEAGVTHAAVLEVFLIPGLPFAPAGARWWPRTPPHREHREALMASNAWVCDLAAAHEPLRAFVSVHPGVMTAAEVAAHVADLADRRGAAGVKFHTIAQRLDPADPALWPLYDLCVERGLPVVAHCGPDRHGQGFATPDAFSAVAERFPRLPLVLAHLGGARWRDVPGFAAAHPGVRFDLSEIVSWVDSEHGPGLEDLAALVRAVGPGRVLMGSDFPWYDPADVIERVEALPGLAREERDAILGANAARLLGIAGG